VGVTIAFLAQSEADLAALPAAPVVAVSPAVAAVTPAVGQAHAVAAAPQTAEPTNGDGHRPTPGERVFASPRARLKASALGVDLATLAYAGDRIVEADVLRAAATGGGPAEGVRLTPLAVRLAAELGIDLADIEAAPGVRIKAADLLAAASRAEASAAPPAVAPLPNLGYGTGEIRSLNRVRRITAERMTYNWQTAPQVTYTSRVDMTKAIALRAELKDIAEARGTRLSYDAMFVRAVATALLEFPQVNAQWAEGEGIRLSSEAHVGVAVDLTDGLIVPVIRNAHARSLLDISAELGRLVSAAREGKLGPDDYKGGTFTISNLGLLGIEAFTPIVNLPEAAILGIGAIVPTATYDGDGNLVRRDLATLSLTADHRIVDGGPAARFLKRVVALMEAPILLIERGL
jgi:pyruvate dehydrogenase E2 component (dihydrolipoamide acetyltransferase)